MFYCHPINDSIFCLTDGDTVQLQNIMKCIPRYLPLTISSDGGRKVKVGSWHSGLWDSLHKIELIYPAFEKVFSKVLSPEWIDKSFCLLKAQSCAKGKKFLDQYDRLVVVKPGLSDLSTPLPNDKDIRNDKKLLDTILPWMPSRELFESQSKDNEGSKTLKVFPRFHFSYMNPGSYILPHLDDYTKLLSMMLYLPSDEQRGDEHLSTIFHQVDSSMVGQFKDTEIIQADKLDAFRNSFEMIRSPFYGKNLIIFTRTQVSWHSVNYPAHVDKGTRLSINVNFHIGRQDSNKRYLLWNEAT